MMRYFIDTEFIEQQFYLYPISIALVAEDGREFYAIVDDHDPARADPWVHQHVLPKLPPRDDSRWMGRAKIAQGLRSFVGETERPEFWAYFASYDWVLFCWLLGGRMVDIPDAWPSLCLDLKQAMIGQGIRKEDLPAIDPNDEHDALTDARWGMASLRILRMT